MLGNLGLIHWSVLCHLSSVNMKPGRNRLRHCLLLDLRHADKNVLERRFHEFMQWPYPQPYQSWRADAYPIQSTSHIYPWFSVRICASKHKVLYHCLWVAGCKQPVWWLPPGWKCFTWGESWSRQKSYCLEKTFVKWAYLLFSMALGIKKMSQMASLKDYRQCAETWTCLVYLPLLWSATLWDQTGL